MVGWKGLFLAGCDESGYMILYFSKKQESILKGAKPYIIPYVYSFLIKAGEDEREESTLSWFLSQRRTWIIVVVGLLCNLIRRWLCRA
jgi:hypothetical protein